MYSGRVDGIIFPQRLVLVHGYDANEKNWERVVMGIPPDLPGRIPTAVARAIEMGAGGIILFGSSVGKEVGGVWKSSGRLMAELLFDQLDKLREFTVLPELKDIDCKKGVPPAFELIEDGDRPANTMGELQALRKLIKERDLKVSGLTCVSSMDHVSRIIRDAHIAFRGSRLAANLSVCGSMTLYTEEDGKTPQERATIDNVVIAEPRFPGVPQMKRMFKIGNNPIALAEIDVVIDEYGG